MIYQTKNNGMKICAFRRGKKYPYSRITLALFKENYIYGFEWNKNYKIIMLGKIAFLKDSNIDDNWHFALRRKNN